MCLTDTKCSQFLNQLLPTHAERNIIMQRTMASRKLSNEDVVEIFRCIHTNTVPEERLRFQVIVVGPNGMKLSPPSYEFKGKFRGALA